MKYPHMENLYKFAKTPVIITEKIHGANIRIKVFANGQIEYGTRNRVLDSIDDFNGFYSSKEVFKNLPYDKMINLVKSHFDSVEKVDNDSFIYPDEMFLIFFGELYGAKIQKGMDYSDLLNGKEKDVIFFDIYSPKYENFLYVNIAKDMIESLGLKFVPIIDVISMKSLLTEWYDDIDGMIEKYKKEAGLERKVEGVVVRLETIPDWKFKLKTSEFEETKKISKGKVGDEKIKVNPYDFVTEERVRHAMDRFYESEGRNPEIEDTKAIIFETYNDIKLDDPDVPNLKILGNAIANTFHKILKDLEDYEKLVADTLLDKPKEK